MSRKSRSAWELDADRYFLVTPNTTYQQVISALMPEQQLTIRYIRNLLLKGKNDRFHLAAVSRDITIEDTVCVGSFYRAVIIEAGNDNATIASVGQSPEHAVRRGLEKAGLTFRG